MKNNIHKLIIITLSILTSFGITHPMSEKKITLSYEDVEYANQLDKYQNVWEKYFSKSTLDASDNIKQFVHNELKKISLTNYKNIKVKLNKNAGYLGAMCSPDTIFISPGTAYIIEKTLKIEEEQNNVIKTLNVCRGVIQHEGGHIMHQHYYKQTAMSFFTFGAWLFYALYSANEQYPMTTFLSVIFGFYIQIFLLRPWHKRIHEQQADEVVLDDEKILEAMAAKFSELDLLCPKEGNYSDILSSHPSNWKRAKRYQERLDLVKKQQNKIESQK